MLTEEGFEEPVAEPSEPDAQMPDQAPKRGRGRGGGRGAGVERRRAQRLVGAVERGLRLPHVFVRLAQHRNTQGPGFVVFSITKRLPTISLTNGELGLCQRKKRKPSTKPWQMTVRLESW